MANPFILIAKAEVTSATPSVDLTFDSSYDNYYLSFSNVVGDTNTHKVCLGITDGTYTAPAAPTLPDPGDETLTKRQFNEQRNEFCDYCVCKVQCLKLLETVFIILKRNHTPLGNYKPDFTVKDAFEYLKSCYVDEKEKRKAAFTLDREIKSTIHTPCKVQANTLKI